MHISASTDNFDFLTKFVHKEYFQSEIGSKNTAIKFNLLELG